MALKQLLDNPHQKSKIPCVCHAMGPATLDPAAVRPGTGLSLPLDALEPRVAAPLNLDWGSHRLLQLCHESMCTTFAT